MTLDEIKRRFVDEVKLRAYDDKYIDTTEEREILQLALNEGVTLDSARSALVQVCEGNDYVLESIVLRNVKDVLDTFAQNDGKVDEKEFNDALAICRKQTKSKLNDNQVKKMVLQVMDDAGMRAKTGWFSNWHSRARSEVGMS